MQGLRAINVGLFSPPSPLSLPPMPVARRRRALCDAVVAKGGQPRRPALKSSLRWMLPP